MNTVENLLSTWSAGDLKPVTVQHSVPTKTIKELGVMLLAVGLIVVLSAVALKRLT